MSDDDYRAPRAEGGAALRELGSRFLATVAPAAGVEAALERIAAARREHPDASHCCWAYRVGWPAVERSSDAGEPAGTAGRPILAALRSAGVSDAVAVVVRWFGGTKLGKGGLVRAYGEVSRAALDGLPCEARFAATKLRLALPYERVGAVKALLRPGAVVLLAERYGERAEVDLAVRLSEEGELRRVLSELGLLGGE